MKNVTRETQGLVIELSRLDEDTHPADHFDDLETVEQVIRDAEVNEWAWCIACVTTTWGPFKGVTYLGGCSYEDAEDFKQGGYYEDMIGDALADLNMKIRTVRAALAELDAQA